MSTQIALLRAVNVGGTGKVAMAELRAAAQSAGLKDVRSLLASGNLVFEAGARSPAATEKLLETMCAKTFGLQTSIFVRSHADLATAIAANPFAKEAKSDPAFLHVVFHRDAIMPAAVAALQAAIKGRERVAAVGRHAYVFFPDGAGQSKLTPAVMQRHLGGPGTARNWNTVRKLADASA